NLYRADRHAAWFLAHSRLWHLGAVLHCWADRCDHQGDIGGAPVERNLWRTIYPIPATCTAPYPRETTIHETEVKFAFMLLPTSWLASKFLLATAVGSSQQKRKRQWG